MSRLQPPEYTSYIDANHLTLFLMSDARLINLYKDMVALKERLECRRISLGDWNHHGDFVRVRDELFRRMRRYDA